MLFDQELIKMIGNSPEQQKNLANIVRVIDRFDAAGDVPEGFEHVSQALGLFLACMIEQEKYEVDFATWLHTDLQSFMKEACTIVSKFDFETSTVKSEDLRFATRLTNAN